MMADSPIHESTLAQKFQAVYEFYTDFTQHVVELHATTAVHDEPSRAAFNSLSRLMAFTDQMNMLLNMMQEDVRVAEELTGPVVSANGTGEIEQYFLEWLRTSKLTSPRPN